MQHGQSIDSGGGYWTFSLSISIRKKMTAVYYDTMSIWNDHHDLSKVLDALRTLRIAAVDDEYSLQNQVAACLKNHDIRYIKEYRLASRCRIDFFVPGGVGIEVKRGKPTKSNVVNQVRRYLQVSELNALVVLTERTLYLPARVAGKPCLSVCLSKLWGVAL